MRLSRYSQPYGFLVELQREQPSRPLHVCCLLTCNLLHNANCVTGPFEYAKVSTQIQVLIAEEARAVALERGLPVPAAPTDIQPIGTVQSARQIVKARGFLGLYTGFRYHLTRDTIGTGLYFTVSSPSLL